MEVIKLFRMHDQEHRPLMTGFTFLRGFHEVMFGIMRSVSENFLAIFYRKDTIFCLQLRKKFTLASKKYRKNNIFNEEKETGGKGVFA